MTGYAAKGKDVYQAKDLPHIQHILRAGNTGRMMQRVKEVNVSFTVINILPGPLRPTANINVSESCGHGQDRTTPYPHFGTPSNIHHFRHFTFHILVPALYLHLRSWTKENGGVVLKIVKLIFVFCHVPPSRMCASHVLFRPITNLFDALFSRRHTQAHST